MDRLARIFLPALLLLPLLLACAAPPPPPPDRLYVFDVSDLHLDHYRLCLAETGSPDACPADLPLPPGKTFPDLLRDYDTLIFLTTLQGIVNRTRPRLYLLHDGPAGIDAFWLAKYREAGQPYGWLADTEIVTLPDLPALLDVFAPDLNGLVLWDPQVPATLNAATTIAGVENLAVLRAGSPLEPLLTAILPVKMSLVGKFDSAGPSPKTAVYAWARAQYLASGRANPRFLAYLEDGWPAVLYSRQKMTRGGVYALERDYVVQERGFAFDLSPWPDPPLDDPSQPPGADRAELEAILQTARAQAGGRLIKIWGFIPWYQKYSAAAGAEAAVSYSGVEGEWESTWLFSRYGGYLQGGGGDVFGAGLANVSVHRFAPPPAPRQPPTPPTQADLVAQGYLTPDGRLSPGRTFVLFYMGDYDLAHPVAALMANHAGQPWLDPRRGDIPLAWGFNPALVEDLPGMMSYLYATQTGQDYFVAANSGAGYLNPDALPETTLLRWLWRSRGFYRRYGYDIQGFLLNGLGAAMSQRRLDAFAWLTPAGMAAPDFEMDEPWPRLQWGVPLTGIASEALAGTPDVAAEAVHTAYRRVVLEQKRPPFLLFRAAFQSPTFMWGVRDRIQAHDAENRITGPNGEILHPNYTVVDPYTFFALLKYTLPE